MAKQRVSLAPLMGVNSRRVADRTLQGTYMRGGYNVELRDGEWWTRAGESPLSTASHVRLGSCPWWWVVQVNSSLVVIANPWWALAVNVTGGVKELYTAAATENVTFTNGSANATTSTTRVVDQLILVGAGTTSEVYRVKSRVGTAMVLDRPYEGTNGTYSCRFIDPLARDVSGTATAYSGAFSNVGSWWVRGSCVVFEQLVSHAATDLYAASPTLTGGNLHLVITSNVGVPVAIDLSAYIAGSTVGVRRTWFYNTALGSAATQIGTDTAVGNIYARGVYAEVYKGRLFIGAATDPNGKYGSRTIWYSQPGDIGRWHTGLAAQTAAPNFKTFDGEGNDIAEMKCLQESLIIHRQDSQEIASITGSLSQPFQFRSNTQGLGVRYYSQTNCVVVANGVHYIWTQRGPAVFDGSSVTPICAEALDALRSVHLTESPFPPLFVLHDSSRGRLYWYAYQTTTSLLPEALPATSTISLKSGESIQDYGTCFVYDYLNNAYWFEHRPRAMGGATVTGTTTGSTPLVSRLDGSLILFAANSLSVTSDGKDADYLAPTTSGSRVPVYAQVETPWMDFGNLSAKWLTEVEITHRGLADGESLAEELISLSGTPWLRMRVYGDKNRATALGDVGVVYDMTASQITTKVDFGQSPTGLLTFTPRSGDLRQMKLVFSNGLTSAATTAGYSVLPFRISDIECEFVQKESKLPKTTLTSASISE